MEKAEEAEEEEEEEEQREVKSTEYDVALTLSIVAKLQAMGENVLIDDFLAGSENGDDEWDAERLLDVLISMQVAGIEKHRGIAQRTSRAFTYRTGYSDTRTNLATLAEDIRREESELEAQVDRCKRLRAELECEGRTREETAAFLRELYKSHKPPPSLSTSNREEGEEGEDAALLQELLK